MKNKHLQQSSCVSSRVIASASCHFLRLYFPTGSYFVRHVSFCQLIKTCIIFAPYWDGSSQMDQSQRLSATKQNDRTGFPLSSQKIHLGHQYHTERSYSTLTKTFGLYWHLAFRCSTKDVSWLHYWHCCHGNIMPLSEPPKEPKLGLGLIMSQ